MSLLKIASVFITTLLLIFFLGAILIPKEKYFEVQNLIPTDPIAVYSKLDNLEKGTDWEQWLGKKRPVKIKLIDSKACSLSLNKIHSEPYVSIKYVIQNNGDCHTELGFLLEKNQNGTRVKSYISCRDLSYPFERWKSLFLPVSMKSGLQKGMDKLYVNLVE